MKSTALLYLLHFVTSGLLSVNITVSASSCPPPSPPPGTPRSYERVLDLRFNEAYEDQRSVDDAYDESKPVDDNSFVNSTTGRPWAECGHFSYEWWGIDLGSEVNVGFVRLQNRNDCCPERLTQVEIYLGSTPNTYIGNALVKSDVNVLSNVMLEVDIDAVGRYLYYRRPPDDQTDFSGLTVCKMYVFLASPSPM